MKTTISHLPEKKQELIRNIVGIIVDRVDPEKVILYGSHATGKWVENQYIEDGKLLEYKSDYDFLVITKSGDLRSDSEVQEMIERRSGIHDDVSAITHDIEYVNGKLSEGQYFFSDIEKEGILLYDAGVTPLAEKKELTAEEKKALAQNDFDIWFKSGNAFLKGSQFYVNENEFNIAAFTLHQAAERFYNTVILVFRGYKPKTHNLQKLLRYAKHFSQKLEEVFPRNTKEEKYLFDLLKKGYVEARYDKNYKITSEELSILITKLKRMSAIVEEICNEKIDSFGKYA